MHHAVCARCERGPALAEHLRLGMRDELATAQDALVAPEGFPTAAEGRHRLLAAQAPGQPLERPA